MKKLLALVLALVMTLGLATVGTNAAVSTELKDADKISDDYKEAIDVVKAIDVMIGDDEGNFRPQDKLTRAEGAKIVAYLNATNKVAADLVGSGNKFSDVPATHWAAGMVEYCAVNKILDGVGGGKFDPSGELKVVAFAKLMLTSLGYDSVAEGYVNNVDWATHVMTRAQRIGLLNGLSGLKPTDVITREQAAQMLYNTLKTPIVEYDQKLYTNDGTVLVGSSAAKPVTNEERGKQTIYANRVNAQQNANGAFVVEFAEQYYPALVLKADEDDFGRPANNWTYGREQIGVWGNYDLLVTEWTKGISGDDVYEAMGALAYKDYAKEVWIDGVKQTGGDLTAITSEIKKDGDDLDITGRGVLTQLFVDDANEYARLVVVNTYLAEALTDYSASAKTISLGVYEKDYDAQVSRTAKLTDDNKIEDLKVGDKVLVTMIKPGTDNYVVESVKLAEVNKDVTVSAYTSGTKGGAHMTSITVDGTKTDVAAKALWKQEILKNYSLEKLKNFTYDVYLDTYGNIIGIDYNKQDTNFLFVVGAEAKSSYLAFTTYSANVIYLDGTMQTINFTTSKSGSARTALSSFKAGTTGSPVVNAWFTYSKTDDGSIILNDIIPTMAYATATDTTYDAYQGANVIANIANAAEVSSTNATMDATTSGGAFAYGNDKSIYITVDVDRTGTYGTGAGAGVGAIKEVTGVSVGIKNTSIEVAQVGTLSNFNGTTPGNNGTIMRDSADATFTAGLAQTSNSNNTYFLYSSKGYVIAAVVVGADSNANRNFMFVISGPSSRQYNGRYLDTYKVIKDGAVTTVDVDSQKSGTTNTKLGAQRLHGVVYDKDGVVVEIKNNATRWTAAGLDVTKNTTINTTVNKNNGYTYNTVANNDNVRLEGNTLKIAGATTNNTSYVLLGEACKFFVRNPANGNYEEVSNATSALSMAKAKDGANQRYIKSISSVIDGATGFAKTVIFYETYSQVAVGDNGVVVVEGTTQPGIYAGAQFYTEDAHPITWSEAQAALNAQMIADGVPADSIKWTAGNTVSYKFGNNEYTNIAIATMNANFTLIDADTAGTLDAQLYKLTYVNAAGTSKTAYVNNGIAMNNAEIVGANALNVTPTNVLVVDTSKGVTTGATAYGAYNTAATLAAMPARNITLYEGANLGAAVTLALKKGDLTINGNLAGTGDVTVPDGKTLTIKNTRSLWVDNVYVNGLVTSENDTDAATLRANTLIQIKGASALVKMPAGTMNATTIQWQDAAQGDVGTIVGTTVQIACSVKVKTITVTNVILVGQAEGSSLEVETTATVTNVYVGNYGVTAATGAVVNPETASGATSGSAAAVSAWTAAKSGSAVLTLPEGKQTAITNVEVLGNFELNNDANVTTVKTGDGAKITVNPEHTDDGASGNGVGTEITTFNTASGTSLVSGNGNKPGVDTVGSTQIDTDAGTAGATTLPTGTTTTSSTSAAPTTSGGASISNKTAVKVSGSAGSPVIATANSSNVYFASGDTVTVTFTKKLDKTTTITTSDTSVATAKIDSDDATKLIITITGEINGSKVDDQTITISDLKVDSSELTSTQEAVECTATFTVQNLKSDGVSFSVN